jgi:RsiW-degrading membrane proteinase PrsW (M82 family)
MSATFSLITSDSASGDESDYDPAMLALIVIVIIIQIIMLIVLVALFRSRRRVDRVVPHERPAPEFMTRNPLVDHPVRFLLLLYLLL